MPAETETIRSGTPAYTQQYVDEQTWLPACCSHGIYAKWVVCSKTLCCTKQPFILALIVQSFYMCQHSILPFYLYTHHMNMH